MRLSILIYICIYKLYTWKSAQEHGCVELSGLVHLLGKDKSPRAQSKTSQIDVCKCIFMMNYKKDIYNF